MSIATRVENMVPANKKKAKFSITEKPANGERVSVLVEAIRKAAEITNMQLIEAAKEGSFRKVKRAYIRGASVKAKDGDGKTAQMHAEEAGHADIVTLLKNLAEDE